MKKIILLLSVIFMSNGVAMEYGGKRSESSDTSDSSVSNDNNAMAEYSDNSTDEQELRRSECKRKQSCYYKNEDSDEQEGNEESSDKVVHVKKRVDSSTLLSVLAPDGKEILTCKVKQHLQRSYLRKLVAHLGYGSEEQIKKIALCYKNQDIQAVRAQADKEKIKLKKYFMQCPGCNQILQNEKKERRLFHAVFIHWFLTNVHQTELRPYASKMFANTEAGAKENYAKHKDTVPKIIPWPGNYGSESEDDGSSDDGELSETSMQEDALMDIDIEGWNNEQVVPVNDRCFLWDYYQVIEMYSLP